MRIYDANGNQVSEATGICSRCGAHIKYIFTFEGKIYGSECIEKVTGIASEFQVFKGNALDLEASKARKEEKANRIAEQIKRNRDLETLRNSIREQNKAKFAELISLLESNSWQEGDFCYEMARNIAHNGFNTNLNDILSYRQFNIVQEIWAKQYGRSNSKGYKAGLEEFESKFCN